MLKKPFLLLSALLVLALTACNLPTGQSPEVSDLALTITAQARLLEPGTPPAVQDTPLPTSTSTPEFTPTVTLTPTPSVPTATVSQNTNCRTGPGTQYDLIGALLIGQSAEVVGKNSASNYWIIKTPGGSGNCWLWGQYATVSGNTANLPEYPVPATPTPSLPAPVKNLKATISCVLQNNPVFINIVTVDLTWSDQSSNEDGFRIYRGGTLLVSLAANSTSYTDNTTLPAIWIIGNPQPSLTYEVEAFNAAGNSNKKDVNVKCP